MNIIATSARWAGSLRGPHRAAVTLVELLFVMAILGILAAISLGALAGATAQARVERTRAIITKIDQLITEKYESYKTRAVPIRVPVGTRPVGEPFQDSPSDNDRTNGIHDSGETHTEQNSNSQYDFGAAEYRLFALRELMRLELPNIKNDVLVGPPNATLSFLSARPALSRNYYRRADSISGGIAAWTEQYEGAECLYMILAAMRDGDDGALDFFSPSEIGDTDGDEMLEVLDAFGNPIEFVRWPAGYSEHPGADGEWGNAGDDDGDGSDGPSEVSWPGSDDILPPPTPQTRNFKKAPDPFDPLKVDGRYRLPNQFIVPFALKPLIYSPGPDKEYNIRKSDLSGVTNLTAAQRLGLLDPYRVIFTPSGSDPARLSAGSPFDPSGKAGFADNITNHDFSE